MRVGKRFRLTRQVWGNTTWYSIQEFMPERGGSSTFRYYGTDLKEALSTTVPEQLTLDLDWED